MASVSLAGDLKTKPVEGRATIGFFMENEGKLYAVVCKHVTLTAKKYFYVRHQLCSDKIIGTKLAGDDDDCFIAYDIGLFEITKEAQVLCKQTFRDLHGNEMNADISIYEGPVENLFGKTVFYGYKEMQDREAAFQCKSGTVMESSQLDGFIQGCIYTENSFVIKSDDKACEGDSGRVVLMKDDGVTKLVGVITGITCPSQTTTEEGQASYRKKEYTVCLLLRKGIEHLKKLTGFELRMYNSEYFGGNKENQIEPGDTVLFNI